MLSAEGQAPGSEADGSSGERPVDYPEIELMHWQHRESVRLVFQDAIQTPAGRDALVRRCCAGVAPQDRQGFIDELQRVAGPLSQDSLSQCLHAFHLMHPLVWSNSQKRAARRGPRPRRCKPHEVAASEMAAVETSDACVRAELSRDTTAAGPLAFGGDAPQGLAQMRAVGPVTTVDSNRVGSREMAAGTRSKCSLTSAASTAAEEASKVMYRHALGFLQQQRQEQQQQGANSTISSSCSRSSSLLLLVQSERRFSACSSSSHGQRWVQGGA